MVKKKVKKATKKAVKKSAKKVAKKVAKKTVAKVPVKSSVLVKVSTKKSGNTLAMAIVALILNILVWPGFGSLIAGRTRVGVWQFFIFLACAILMSLFYVLNYLALFSIFGIVVAADWIWALVTGVRLIQDAQ